MVVIVSDGASTNRKFFKLHKSSDCTRDGIVYKTKNIIDPSRYNNGYNYAVKRANNNSIGIFGL